MNIGNPGVKGKVAGKLLHLTRGKSLVDQRIADAGFSGNNAAEIQGFCLF
jgi:hypothetical protein